MNAQPNPERFALKRTIVLVGMMGAGKTAIGRALAARLGAPFKDSDHEVELAANMTIAEIFERDGEPFFRDKEAQVIARLLDETPSILSTGGGAFLRDDTKAAIAERGLSVWLEADLELLWERVRHKDTRPLLRTPDPKATLARIMAERVPHYAQAGLAVAADPKYSIEDMTDAVIAALSARPDVLEVQNA